MKSFLFLFSFGYLKTNRFSFSFYKTKRNLFRFHFRFRNENRSGIEYVRCGLLRSMIPASVSLSRVRALAKTAERIDVLSGVATDLGDPRNIVLDGVDADFARIL